MPRVFLAPYAVRVRSRDDGVVVTLSDFGSSHDLLDIWSAYLEEREAEASHDQDSQKLLRVTRRAPLQRRIAGVIETGEYGYESTLMDAESAAVSYERQSTDAEMLPFYFLLSVPEGRDEGILLLQRTGTRGIRKLLLADFGRTFNSQHSAFRFEVNPLIPQQLIDRYLGDGRVTKFRFIKFDIPSDITDAFDADGHDEDPGYVELVVKARRNRTLPLMDRLQSVLSGDRDVNQIIELSDMDFDYDAVKVEVDLQGNRRTVDLSHLHRLRSNYDVTDQVELGLGGHPTFDSMNGAAQQLLADLADSIG